MTTETKKQFTFFQDLDIDWNKATTEYSFTDFNSISSLDETDYLYKIEMTRALQWVEKVTTDNYNTNNIFSIVGDRGTGKSSFIETLGTALRKNVHRSNQDERKKLYILPKINPTIFDGKIDIIELLVAILKNQSEKNLERSGRLDDHYFQERTRFNKIVNEIITLLKDRRIEKSAFSERNSGAEVLINIQNQQNFSEKIADLIKSFLNIMYDGKVHYTHIVLQIDDLDLVPNKFANQMLQYIVNFLKNQANLLIFIAYREEQLYNSVLDSLITDNKNLLSEKEINLNEIREQGANFLEKSLPRPQRVYLRITNETSLKAVVKPFVEEGAIKAFDEFILQYPSDLTLQQFIQSQVMEQVRIQVEPIDQFEYTRFVYPSSLRGSLQYLEILFKMNNYQGALEKRKETNHNKDEVLDSLIFLQNNISMLKDYLIGKSREDLRKNSFNILNEWLERDYFSRNTFICVKLLSLIERDLTYSEETIIKKQSYNVSLGDVFVSLESYKEEFIKYEDSMQLVYILKVMYSIENLNAFIQAAINYCEIDEEDLEKFDSNQENIGLDKYIALVKGKIMPDGYYYNQEISSSKTSVIYSKNQDDFLKKIVYSDLAAKGEVETRGKLALPITEKWNQMKYREFFKKKNFINGTEYYIDLYAQLTDYDYLMNIVKECFDYRSNNYLFYSMFDLDFFVRKTYARQSYLTNNRALKYTLNRINDVFIGKLRTAEEISMRRMMVVPLLGTFEKNIRIISSEYDVLFKEKDTVVPYEIFKQDVIKIIDDGEKNTNDVELERIQPTNKELLSQIDLLKILGDFEELKKFLVNYKAKVKEWPSSFTKRERARADLLTRKGNRAQESNKDLILLDKIEFDLLFALDDNFDIEDFTSES